MRERRSAWRAGTLGIACALALAAIGCGDDSGSVDTDGGAGESGSGGGGSGGKGGSGSSGNGGSGGSGVSAMECVTKTTTLFKDMPGALSSDCISCACDQDAKAIVDCNGDANCWALISCGDQNNCTASGVDTISCVTTHCMKFLAGGGKAQAASTVLESSACKTKCVPDTSDAGVDDAGM